MVSKLSWISFIPFTIAAVVLKVISLFFVTDGTFYGLDSQMLAYLSIACVLAVFIFALIFCLCDRKIAPVYKLNKNVVSGVVGLLLAVSLACDGANMAFSIFRAGEYGFFAVADAVLTVLCAIVFVVLGLNHFVGEGGVRGLAVFYLIPVLFSALRLVSCFLVITTESVVSVDITKLVCYIFITLFLFNYAMIVALMQGKSPVKSSFIYGMPAVAALLCYAVYTFSTKFGGSLSYVPSIFSILEDIELVLFGLYILSFIVEITSKVKRKSEIEIIDELDEETYEEVDDADSDILNALNNSANNGNKADTIVNTKLDKDHPVADDDEVFITIAENSMNTTEDEEMYISNVDTSGYIYTQQDLEDAPMTVAEDFQVEVEETIDAYITKESSTYDTEEDYEDDADSALDRIDKLILEISEDEF